MTWAVRVRQERRLGTGTVISSRLAITAHHVVANGENAEVETPDGNVVAAVIDRDAELDVALLVPSSETDVFSYDLRVIPRLLYRGHRLCEGRALIELCTDEPGASRTLDVEVRPSDERTEWVEFLVEPGRDGVRHGYSGGPVLEVAQYSRRPRLFGIVRARDELSVTVDLTAGRGWFVPVDRMAERFESVNALVETPIERSAAWDEHWEPRSRGVATAADPGFFFTGRTKAYERLRAHLERGRGLLVISGPRGRGKSALLARVVVLGCRRYLTLLGEARADAVRGYMVPALPIDAAVMARGKSTTAISAEIGMQLGLGDTPPDDLILAIRRERGTVAVVLDAVDEAQEPDALLRELVLPLADTGARLAIAALVRNIDRYIGSAERVDLDSDGYRDDDAIPSYVARRLVAANYSAHDARAVGEAVAVRAAGLFIVAQLAAKTLAERPSLDLTIPQWTHGLPSDVTEAFNDYLNRFGEFRSRVLAVLAPLAYAYGDGLSIEPGDVWVAVANELRPRDVEPIGIEDVRTACRQAGDYLITARGTGRARLYHEGLAEAIRVLSARERLLTGGDTPTATAVAAEAERSAHLVLGALLLFLPASDALALDFLACDSYILEHLPAHLARCGRSVDLLRRPGLLLAADAEAVRGALARDALNVPSHYEPARVAIVHALATHRADMVERAAVVCAALSAQGQHELVGQFRRAVIPDELTDPNYAYLPFEFVAGPPLPPVVASIEHAHPDCASSLATCSFDGEPLILSGGSQGELRSWRVDGTCGPLTRDDAHESEIAAVTVLEGSQLVVTAAGSNIRSWRFNGSPGMISIDGAHGAGILALSSVARLGSPLVLSAGKDGAIRGWTLAGELSLEVIAHPGEWVMSLVTATIDGEPFVISGGSDTAIRSWYLNGAPGPLQIERAHRRRVLALSVTIWKGATYIVSVGDESSAKTWTIQGRPGPLNTEPQGFTLFGELAIAGTQEPPVVIVSKARGDISSWYLDGRPAPLNTEHAHPRKITALAVIEDTPQPLVVSAGFEAAIRVWDVNATPAELHSHHEGRITGLAAINYSGATLLVSTGVDGTLRTWWDDGAPGPTTADLGCRIMALGVAKTAGDSYVVTADVRGGMAVWQLDGACLQSWDAHPDRIMAVAVTEDDAGPFVVTSSTDGLRSWRLNGDPGPIRSDPFESSVVRLVPTNHGGIPILIGGTSYGRIRSWYLDGSDGPLRVDDAHDRRIEGLVVVRLDGEPLVVSASQEGVIRSWFPTGEPGPLTVTKAHDHWLTALAAVEQAPAPLIVSADARGQLRSWTLEGATGPLENDFAHRRGIGAIEVLYGDASVRVVCADVEGVILSHRLDTARVPDPANRQLLGGSNETL